MDRLRATMPGMVQLVPPEGFPLNDEQRAAVTHEGGHCLVLAGAGTGKTRTIVGRAATLLRAGVPPERLLLLAFTRRAAGELRTRLAGLCGPSAEAVNAGTFHHFCLGTMRRMPTAFGLEGMNVLDREDAEELWKLSRAAHVVPGEARVPPAKQIAGWYGYARNADLQLDAYLRKHVDVLDPGVLERVHAIVAEYETRKRRRRYLDFDDILVVFADRLRDDRRLAATIAARYDEILCDEFQDTNPVQWRMLDALCGGRQERARLFLGGRVNPGIPRLYAVGDDAQSIYAFRGADLANVHAFAKRMPGATVRRLERNYRSWQDILDVSNWLLGRSPLDYRKRLVAHRGPAPRGADRPVLRSYEGPDAEALGIAQDIAGRHEEAGAAWTDHLVLVRSATAARPIEAAFIEQGIPYRFVGGTSLLAAAHVKDLFALLRAVQSHRDDLAWSRFVHLYPKVGDAAAGRIVGAMEPVDGWQDAVEAGRLVSPNRDPFRLAEEVRALADTPAEAIGAATRGLTPILETRYDHWRQRARDLELLGRLAARHRTIGGFLDTYTLDPVITETLRPGEDPDVVTLSTIHGAKGTEARTVFVAAATPSNHPHFLSRGDPAGIEEERRVLYVALTRAMDELIITRGEGAADGGWVSFEQDAGYLLADLPPALVREEVVAPPAFDPRGDDAATPAPRPDDGPARGMRPARPAPSTPSPPARSRARASRSGAETTSSAPAGAVPRAPEFPPMVPESAPLHERIAVERPAGERRVRIVRETGPAFEFVLEETALVVRVARPGGLMEARTTRAGTRHVAETIRLISQAVLGGAGVREFVAMMGERRSRLRVGGSAVPVPVVRIVMAEGTHAETLCLSPSDAVSVARALKHLPRS